MKVSKADVFVRSHKIPNLRFADQEITSFSGLVLYQALFQRLDLPARIRSCTRGVREKTSYRLASVLMLLIVHLSLGWKRLRDLDYYRDDPLLGRTVGIRKIPSVSTLSRFLKSIDRGVLERYRELSREFVLQRLIESCPSRITLDFDGSVLSTKSRRTEGTAIGFNRKAKGSRSYYPLFATVAQTGQIFDYLFRPGNVHDSKGAREFIERCFFSLLQEGYHGKREARIDGAFFSDEILFSMAVQDIEFTASVPFMRFPELKEEVENRKRWKRIDETWSFFETDWKPKSWEAHLRIIVYRQLKKVPSKGELQLDLFEPIHREYEYKVVATNRRHSAKAVLAFHNGRGSQEGTFAECKSQAAMGYVATRRRAGNEAYLTSAVLAHNLNREMQMIESPPNRANTAKRACLWCFEQIDSIRRAIVQRAGRITRPQGRLTLTMADNEPTRNRFLGILSALQDAA